MRRAAMLIALSMLTTACSSAESELARMRELPLAAAVDVNDDTTSNGPDTGAPATAPEPAGAGDQGSTIPDVTAPAAEDGDGETTSTDLEPSPTRVPVVEPVILERFPHDGRAFTQGLAFTDGVLIESLGLLGESGRRRVAPTTGEVISSAPLSPDLFGAGLAVVDGQLIQLTWQQGIAIVADLTTLIEVSRFTYDGEGWGLCMLDDSSLVMSNGSGVLTVRDVNTFEVTGEIEVTIDGAPTSNLNELECVGQSIYANVWLESEILEIDAASGAVRRIIDASALVPGDLTPDDVLNGIAYRPETDTFFLTGKRWTVMYEVRLS